MSLVFINGNFARCRDCTYYDDGRCTNAKHVRTHGSGRVSGDQRTCFDAEEKDDQMEMEGF